MHVIERSECEVKARRGPECLLSTWPTSLELVCVSALSELSLSSLDEIRHKLPRGVKPAYSH